LEAALYSWKAEYGSMDVSDAKRLKGLEGENAKLKKLLAERMLDAGCCSAPAFMAHCNGHIGEGYFRTPRNTIRAFMQFLAVIEQNPGTRWTDLVASVAVAADAGEPEQEIADGPSETGVGGPSASDDELVTLRL